MFSPTNQESALAKYRMEKDSHFELEIWGISKDQYENLELMLNVIHTCVHNTILENALWYDLRLWLPLNLPKALKWNDIGTISLRDLIPSENRKYFPESVNLNARSSARFSRILSYFDSLISSTSPFVYYRPPYLLERMGEDDFQIETKDSANESSLSRTSSRISNSNSRGNSRERGNSRYIINPSDRISLKSMISCYTSASSFIAGQSLYVLHMIYRIPKSNEEKEPYYQLAPPCKTEKISFNFFASYDPTLKSFLEQMSNRANDRCESCFENHEHTCFSWQHVHFYSHGNGRILISIRGQRLPLDKTAIWTRYSCSKCKRSTGPKRLSSFAEKYSSGKFLEQLLYNDHFICKTDELCKSVEKPEVLSKHPKKDCDGQVSSHESFIELEFYYNDFVITMKKENIRQRYEIALPCDRLKSLMLNVDIETKIRERLDRFFSNMKFKLIHLSDEGNHSIKNFLQTLEFEELKMCQSLTFISHEDVESDIDNKLLSLEREYQHLLSIDNHTISAYAPHKQSYYYKLQDIDKNDLGKVISFVLSSPLVHQCLHSLKDLTHDAMNDELWPENLFDVDSSTKKCEILFKRIKILFNTGKYVLEYATKYENVHESVIVENGFDLRYHRTVTDISARKTSDKISDIRITLHYAVFFDFLRETYDISLMSFMQSLMNLSEWGPSGGKTTAKFWKSEDQTLIVKEHSRPMSLSVLGTSRTNFILKYLCYVLFDRFPIKGDSKRSASHSPSLLVPILGLFSVNVKTATDHIFGSNVSSLGIIIMNNLFFGYNIVQKYDLKGILGRYIENVAGLDYGNGMFQFLFTRRFKEKETSVMGDDKFYDSTISNIDDPLHVHTHSRYLLLHTMKEDLKFLSECGIIDYSLLIGVDKNGILVAGIVDYLCEYGIIKVLERRSKSGAKILETKLRQFIGVDYKKSLSLEVTVKPPIGYAERMLSAMDVYFPLIPDKWSQAEE